MSKHKVFETLERIAQRSQRLTSFDADLVNRIEAGVANDPQQSRAIRDIKQRLEQMAATTEAAALSPSPSPSFFRQEFQAVPPAATTSTSRPPLGMARTRERMEQELRELTERRYRESNQPPSSPMEPSYSELMRIAYQEQYERDQARIERVQRIRRARGVILADDEPPDTPSTIVEAAAPEPELPKVQGSSASAERPRRRILTKRISTDEIPAEPGVRNDAGR